MEKYANKDNIVKNEIYESFKESIICPICKDLLLEPFICLKCLQISCKKCKDNKKCASNCDSPKFKEVTGNQKIITKFKFVCINGCGEEILFDDLKKHYESDCLSKKNKTKILSSKQAAEYTKKTGNDIPIVSSILYIFIIFVNSNNFRQQWSWEIFFSPFT